MSEVGILENVLEPGGMTSTMRRPGHAGRRGGAPVLPCFESCHVSPWRQAEPLHHGERYSLHAVQRVTCCCIRGQSVQREGKSLLGERLMVYTKTVMGMLTGFGQLVFA